MSEDRSWILKLQLAIYLTETLAITGILALAASRSPELLLGPLARVVVAASLPLPCHLLWLAHFLWHGQERQRRASVPTLELQPVPQTLPAMAGRASR